ncbi:MAG: hypothetical protein HQL15_02985 [Candidatus Omnitrophica bacterium]|nr:hypothetical protein [Candidatus Omnitrophota bacterium]
MTKRKTTKKTLTVKKRDSLHLKLAYNLGRTVKKVSKTVAKVHKSPYKRIHPKSKEPLSPILKEIKAIADISGLTAALEDMNDISLKHSKHPVVSQLTAKIQQLSPHQQEDLSRRFIERLKMSPHFNNPMMSFPGPTELTEEDCQKISDEFIECIFYTLEEIGMTSQEQEFLKKFSNEMTRPINELIQFYLHPKTLSQKLKRLWRIQRIFIKMIKLISMTNAMTMENAEAMRMGGAVFEENMSSVGWLPTGVPGVSIKDTSQTKGRK